MSNPIWFLVRNKSNYKSDTDSGKSINTDCLVMAQELYQLRQALVHRRKTTQFKLYGEPAMFSAPNTTPNSCILGSNQCCLPSVKT